MQVIPGFEGNAHPGNDLSLGIILGFEGYKALHAWERIGPNDVIAFLGDPPYESSYLEKSRRENESLLRLGNITEERLDTNDVLKAKTKLQEVYDRIRSTKKNVDFSLCPLGTKEVSN